MTDNDMNVFDLRHRAIEVERVLMTHPGVSEAVVIDSTDDKKGEFDCAFLVLRAGEKPTSTLYDEFREDVQNRIGQSAVPVNFFCVCALPKTGSGEIMRRVLQKIAACNYDHLGDLSGSGNASVVRHIVASHKLCKEAAAKVLDELKYCSGTFGR